MYIKPTNNAKSLWDINEELASEALLIPVNEQVPCPWDAGIDIEGVTVVLTGSMQPGGPFGVCSCRFPVGLFTALFQLEVPDSFVSDHMSEEDLQALWDGGWERA